MALGEQHSRMHRLMCREMIFDEPFVYAITNKDGVPIFTGVFA